MILEGGCHCGAVRYELSGAAEHSSVCHCADCRHIAGAPMVGWTGVKAERFRVTKGEPATYRSSALAERTFCARCGTGLWYVNETVLPGLVDVQTCTLDDPEALVPAVQIQTAERLAWVPELAALPGFERYPG